VTAEIHSVLITGGAGFIGSHFVAYLKTAHPDWQLVNLDILSYASDAPLAKEGSGRNGYVFVQGDICDRGLIEKLFETHAFDAVVNIAAETHVDRSIQDSTPFLRTNVEGTGVLLEMARAYKVRRFLQVSTDEVYGSLSMEDPPCTETSELAPNSPYAASKTSADLVARSYFQTYGVPVLITRCCNNYGPRQYPEKLIPLMVARAMDNKQLPVYGDGLNVREWIHVRDHCRALKAVLLGGLAGGIYNIGSGEDLTNITLVKKILQHLERKEDLIRFVQDRPGHDRRYAIDSAKIRNELNWSCDFSMADGLHDTFQWYCDHEDWWRPLMQEVAASRKDLSS